jgi:xanthine dehydrogenase/oxidase
MFCAGAKRCFSAARLGVQQMAGKESRFRFLLNGQPWVLDRPSPTLLLIDWLRSPEVGLTGTKKSCGQGGCGVCTVMLSRWDRATGKVEHNAVNACLRPVWSLDGMAVTTTEGVGSTRTMLNPVQHRLAIEAGSQCGYCTPGWVMAMTAFLAANPDRKPTQIEIERMLDGNLCRCTGYRPILYAMRHFASDWTADDEAGSIVCTADPDLPHSDQIAAPTLPPDLGLSPAPFERDGRSWYGATSLEAALELLHRLPLEGVRLINGNTSLGVYEREARSAVYLIDISRLAELKRREAGPERLYLGGGVTYSELIEFLEPFCSPASERGGDTGLSALRLTAQRTAGTMVRNVATLAGNTMLVVRHAREGAPFPSDLFTALAALDARVEVAVEADAAPVQMPILDFATAWQDDAALQRGVLVGYVVPRTREREFARTYKVARREVNAHAIVNAGCRVRFDERGATTEATIVLGGIAPVAFHAEETERALIGRAWDSAALADAITAMGQDLDCALAQWRECLDSQPYDGVTPAYRRQLALSFLYRFFIEIAQATGSIPIPPQIVSAETGPQRPLSRGAQSAPANRDPPPAGLPLIKLDAFLHSTGEARYTHDLPLPPRGVNGAFVLSNCASGAFAFRIPGADDGPVDGQALGVWLRSRFAGFVALLTADDIPAGRNNLTPGVAQQLGGVDPMLADGRVGWFGQPVALALADSEADAEEIAQFVREACLFSPDDPADKPVLTIDQAVAAGSLFADTSESPFNHILSIKRPDSTFDWVGAEGEVTLDGQACLVVNGVQSTGAQAHFYMETQSALATPGEGGRMTIHPSTQSPALLHSTIASVLDVPLSRVALSIRRVGGGFGGKTSRSLFVAAPAALAASQLGRPVRIALPRATDMEMIGRRHPYRGQYSIAVATGDQASVPRGRIVGLSLNFVSDGGATYDCSFTVMDCTQMRGDSAYMIPNWETQGRVARTNLASNTAFRSYGSIQGNLILEDAIAHAAHALDMRAEDLREINLYSPGQETIVGTVLDTCYIRQVWRQLRESARFDARAAEVDRFNAANRWRKRGIAMIPVQYGAGFNATFLEQAGALVDVYDEDGSVLVHQGGVEVGQGLATIVAQAAAEALDLPLDFITVADTDIGIVPNPIQTSASTGSGFNAEAVRTACLELRRRLTKYARHLEAARGAAWCAEQHVDFWNYPGGWKTPLPAQEGAPPRLMWQAIVSAANFDRINLSAQCQIRIRGGEALAKNLYFTSPGTAEIGATQFTGYTFSAACSEVEIDVLTGETTVLRSDLLYDVGDSFNPALDIGQLEGGFVQGIGNMLTEEIVIEPDGRSAGRLNSSNTWDYKVPAAASIPLELNVAFFPRAAVGLPPKHDIVLGSKEVGEPPLVLATSVYFAVKNAVASARRDRGHTDWFEIAAPATVQRVREACRVEAADLTI